MSSTLYTATVGVYLQILPQLARMIDKAEAYCTEKGLPPKALTDARLAPDMWNFSLQVMWAVLNSAGAVEALRTGLTGPYTSAPPTDFAPLRGMIADGIALLESATPEEVEAAGLRDVRLEFGAGGMEFVGEDFLLSFALPNFFFHASTAYAILRHQGLDLGKRHFLGRVRVKA